MQLKTRLRTNLYTVKESGLQTNTSNIGGIALRSGGDTQ